MSRLAVSIEGQDLGDFFTIGMRIEHITHFGLLFLE